VRGHCRLHRRALKQRMSRTYEDIRKQLDLDFLVAANRRAIVETVEPVWNRILLFRQKIQQLFKQLSRLWTWLNYSVHDSHSNSAHYRACF
jgi:hypothetical protein